MIKAKLLGSLLIIVATTFVGIEYSRKYIERLKNLIYIQNCIQMLETEIVYASNQLPDAFENIYIKGNKKVSFLFKDTIEYLSANNDKSLFESFKHSIEKSKFKLFLQDDDIEVLLSLGRVLGTSDIFDQEKHFKTTIMNLEINQKDAKENRDRNAKMYRSLGVLFGTALVLILY